MTSAKRQREASQKDRVKEREERRNERQARTAERRAAGLVGAPIDEIRFAPDGTLLTPIDGDAGSAADDNAPAPDAASAPAGDPPSP